MHAAKAAESTRHSKVAPGSLENVNVGVETFVGPLGPESIVVSGGIASRERRMVKLPSPVIWRR